MVLDEIKLRQTVHFPRTTREGGATVVQSGDIMSRALQATESASKADKPDEVFRRHIFEPTLKTKMERERAGIC